MNTPIDIEPRKSPFFGSSRHHSAPSLPPDLVAKAQRRLGALALFFTILGGISIPIHLAFLATGMESLTQMLCDLGAAVIAAIVYVLARIPRMSIQRVFALGIVFEFTICFNAALTAELYVQDHFGHSPLMPAAGILIVLFPLIIPTRPRDAALISLLAATTQPMAQGLLEALGLFDVTLYGYGLTFGGALLAGALAVFGSQVLYGVSVEVARAREMGSYHLEERMAQGGMGEVWRARHHMLVRPAAIKLVRNDIAHSDDREQVMRRFEREAQVTATLESPHTVQLYDFGVTQDGAYYYVMELLDGIDLDKLVHRHGPLPPERVIHIVRQLCHSLQEAHDKGLVHRDIKPSNILLCHYGPDFDFVKVLDFGLVSLRPELAAGDGRLTADGIVGTPAFIAPEIASGESDKVDHRVDLYALGCVTYWLVTGSLVFEHKSTLGLLVAHARELPPRPSTMVEQSLPPALDDLILECLAKDPDERPQSAAEIRDRLAAIELEPAWDRDRARQWWQTHRPDDTKNAAGADVTQSLDRPRRRGDDDAGREPAASNPTLESAPARAS